MNKHQHCKIFLTDDHPVITYGLSCLFSNLPDTEVVGIAHAASDMFRTLPKARPTLLLLDLNLPGSDFYENIAWVRKYAPWVRIVIYSGYYMPDLVKALFTEGVSGYISKQAKPSELIEAIQIVACGGEMIVPPAHAQSDNLPHPVQPDLPDDFRKRLGLSKREQEILELISRGMSSQNIGKTLYISKHTVETHRKNILRKLDFNSSTELVKFAVQQGLV